MSLSDYSESMYDQITIFDSPYYPDFLEGAKAIHFPTIEQFEELMNTASTSAELLTLISNEKNPMRTQLLRIFRKYVSPDTSVEMLKVKRKIPRIISEFGSRFRDIETVRAHFASQGSNDLVLVALLNEYSSRGTKGYALTEAFFNWFDEKFDDLELSGPIRAGKDLILSDHLPNFSLKIPADFIIKSEKNIVAVGFARYDSDRGGAQEDDRIKGNRNNAIELLDYNRNFNKNIKVIFLNDGPGLLLGSMWKDYIELEELSFETIKVLTLKMLDARLTEDWLKS